MPLTGEKEEGNATPSETAKALESGCRGVVPSSIKGAPRGFFAEFASLASSFDADCRGELEV